MSKTYQVVGIGNAVSDVISQASDTFLDHMGIEKGIMQLIERDRAEVLYAAMDGRTETPGGSVANTIAGVGMLGLKAAFVGRVADDALGQAYAAALAAEGTGFPNGPIGDPDLPTSRSMIFVSPDGERSMNTYLGISSEVSPTDVPEAVMRDCDYVFLEGYLFDKAPGKAAFYHASKIAHEAGAKVGISLSDPFCVDRHRADFRHLVSDEMDYVICNEHELCSLYENEDLNAALDIAAGECDLIACTCSGDGVIIRQGATQVKVPVEVITPVDATGAGDQFAAGFLYGLVTGQNLETAGRMGCIAAGEVIRHVGPRPAQDIKSLFTDQGLI